MVVAVRGAEAVVPPGACSGWGIRLGWGRDANQGVGSPNGAECLFLKHILDLPFFT